MKGERAVVWGLGIFGGGASAARFLAEEGAVVRVIDTKPAEALASSLQRLEGLPIEFRLGREHGPDDFLDADLVVKNPAIPPSSPWLTVLEQAGIPWTSEIALGLRRVQVPYAMITGSKGKSTTAALLGAMLAGDGARVAVAGNNERPLLDALRGDPDLLVLEISSFMGEAIARSSCPVRAPEAIAFTSLSPEHLNWHGDVESYYGAKLSLLDLEPKQVVIPARDAELAARVPKLWGRAILRTGRGLGAPFPPEQLRLLGEHNLENALVAGAVAVAMGATPAAIEAGVAAFRPLEHRLETVGTTARGVRIVNDSTATTPEAATAALEAVPAPVVLLAGGSDKGADYTALGEAAARSAHTVVCLGQVGERIAHAVEAAVDRGLGSTRVLRVASFEEAFSEGLARCEPGGSLLLSPAAASYDMFRNFKARGERFRELAAQACAG